MGCQILKRGLAMTSISEGDLLFDLDQDTFVLVCSSLERVPGYDPPGVKNSAWKIIAFTTTGNVVYLWESKVALNRSLHVGDLVQV
jgi:hypothetical protein